MPFDFSLSCADVLVEINASVGELAEGSLLLELGGLFGILVKRFVSKIFLPSFCLEGGIRSRRQP